MAEGKVNLKEERKSRNKAKRSKILRSYTP